MQNRLKNRMISPALNEDGIAMLTSLMIMVLLLVIAGAALHSVRQEIQITGNFQGSVQALHAAEAGAEKVYDALKLGDTNGDGHFDVGVDLVNGNNDLDGDNTNDFLQVFIEKRNIGSEASPITVNSGTNIQAFIWVDASAAPDVSIHSRGNPAGTNSQREVILDVKIYGDDIIYGALNNSS